MKLVAITFEGVSRIPGMRVGAMSEFKLDEPHEMSKHWTVSIRGASVLFISPPGWVKGRPWHEWDPNGARVVHEVPRTQCMLHWSGVPDVEAFAKSAAKYDSEPLGGPVPPIEQKPKSLLEQLDSKDIGDA